MAKIGDTTDSTPRGKKLTSANAALANIQRYLDEAKRRTIALRDIDQSGMEPGDVSDLATVLADIAEKAAEVVTEAQGG